VSHVIGRVVVGVSGSPGSLQALRFAVGHARAFNATLVPVIAWEPPGGDSANRRFPSYLADEWATAAEARLLNAFDEGLGALPPDLPTQPLVIRGPAKRVMVAVAERDNDLLVVGAGHRGFLHRAWYGSVPRYVLAHAPCAVITVPPSQLATEARRSWSGPRLRRAPRDGAAALETRRTGPRPQRDRIDLAGWDRFQER
jgi:nucleotide-binding universal stress UspA family protein